MNIHTVRGTLILGALLAGTAPSTLSLAQTNEKAVSAPSAAGAAATGNVANAARVNTNTNPVKHRYWRHRGGVHPHYGSRRVRSHVHTPK